MNFQCPLIKCPSRHLAFPSKDLDTMVRAIVHDELKQCSIIQEKPKKKVKLEGWMNFYGHRHTDFYLSKNDADEFQAPGRIACIPLGGEYEVEE